MKNILYSIGIIGGASSIVLSSNTAALVSLRSTINDKRQSKETLAAIKFYKKYLKVLKNHGNLNVRKSLSVKQTKPIMNFSDGIYSAHQHDWGTRLGWSWKRYHDLRNNDNNLLYNDLIKLKLKPTSDDIENDINREGAIVKLAFNIGALVLSLGGAALGMPDEEIAGLEISKLEKAIKILITDWNAGKAITIAGVTYDTYDKFQKLISSLTDLENFLNGNNHILFSQPINTNGTIQSDWDSYPVDGGKIFSSQYKYFQGHTTWNPDPPFNIERHWDHDYFQTGFKLENLATNHMTREDNDITKRFTIDTCPTGEIPDGFINFSPSVQNIYLDKNYQYMCSGFLNKDISWEQNSPMLKIINNHIIQNSSTDFEIMPSVFSNLLNSANNYASGSYNTGHYTYGDANKYMGTSNSLGLFSASVGPNDANNFSDIEGGAPYHINHFDSNFKYWYNGDTKKQNYVWSRNSFDDRSYDISIPIKISNLDKGLFTINDNPKNTEEYYQKHFMDLINNPHQFILNNSHQLFAPVCRIEKY